jgi:SAM-dependent methyltransferase
LPNLPNPIHAVRLRMRHAQDRAFDRAAGVDTVERVPAEQLSLPTGCAGDGLDYDATTVADFRRVIRKSGVAFAQTTFIDLGCGKGRTLMMAANAGFDRVIGVEADHGLCKTARRNAEIWRELHPTSAAIEVVEEDAQSFQFPAGNLFVYLYNPFSGSVFDTVIARLATLAEDSSRQLLIAYAHNQLADRIDASGAFERRNLRPLLPWRRSTVSFYRPRR